MPTEDFPKGFTREEEIETEAHSFDELARGLAASELSRSRALRLTGAALLGGALGIFSWQKDADARRRRRRRKRRPPPPPPPPPTCSALYIVVPCCYDGTTSCRPDACVCPEGSRCVSAPAFPGQPPGQFVCAP